MNYQDLDDRSFAGLVRAAMLFVPASAYATGASPLGSAAGDFNRDGKIDLAAANSDANSVLTGTGTATPAALALTRSPTSQRGATTSSSPRRRGSSSRRPRAASRT